MLCIRNNKITKRSNQAKSRGKLGSRVILLQGVTLNQDLIQSKRSYELSDQPSCIGRPKQCEEFENIYLKQSSKTAKRPICQYRLVYTRTNTSDTGKRILTTLPVLLSFLCPVSSFKQDPSSTSISFHRIAAKQSYQLIIQN